ncbi:S1 family peptidase [Methylocystis hirsuta]|uniref:Serine protease n=1 Tax=Methylocystis hirsuta TaxID=369798 RepID=A0A3M9XNT5_9HYPH|nr:serine protease [Methylocystis hirsuta]RNJ48778.1 serine protease [Methylocystis hirsuta]
MTNQQVRATETHIVADFSNGEFPTIQKFPHPIQMSVLPVVAYRCGAEFVPLGTCFTVSPQGLVLTARHVIEEMTALNARRDQNSEQWWIGCLYVAEPAPEHEVPDLLGGILPAHKVFLCDDLDIAAIQLNLPTDTRTGKTLRMPASRISPGLPPVGSFCFAVGYHSMSWKDCAGADAQVYQNFSASRGLIKVLHTPYRDKVSLNFPCFETSARFDGGMSGGPIMGDNGAVIGVVCSSLGNPDELGHISYGSLIGPALLLQLEAKQPDGAEGFVFLHDFVVGGAVVVDDTISGLKSQRLEDRLIIDFGDGKTFQNLLRKS